MKPRITYGWYCFYPLASLAVGGWYCRGGGFEGWGVTPSGAYSDWKKKAPAFDGLEPGQAVEQHDYPRKPTRLQRIKLFFTRQTTDLPFGYAHYR